MASNQYRPEIDGLRAIAIIAVVLFHAGIKCSGGFIGVDVFFVISGYLITKIILRESQDGTFSLISFWERRLRRILPALSVVVLVTLICGSFLLIPKDYSKLGLSIVYQTLFLANYFHYHDAGYFASESEEKPLLHTWSLAVEEQFYIVLPLVIILFRNRQLLLWSLLLCAIISLTTCCFTIRYDKMAAFFLLPSRAWELLVGSIVALIPDSWTQRNKFINESLALLGLLMILISIVSLNRNMIFPGILAFPAVLGTALVIFSNNRPNYSKPPTFCGQILAAKPLVFLGLISYSLYLWHWPIIAFANYWSFEPHSKLTKCLLVSLALIISFLSWKYIEIPFRKRCVFGGRNKLFHFAVASVSLFAVLGFIISNTRQSSISDPLAYVVAGKNISSSHAMKTNQVGLDQILRDEIIKIGSIEPDSKYTALLWGDSHAMAALPAYNEAFKSLGISGCAIVHSGVAPIFDFDVQLPNGTEINTIEYNNAVKYWIKKNRISHVVLVGYWRVYETKGSFGVLTSHKKLSWDHYYKEKLRETVKILISMGCSPWIMLQVPQHQFNPPKAFTFCKHFGGDERNFMTPVLNWNGLAGEDSSFLKELIGLGVGMIDARLPFYDQIKDNYIFHHNNTILYGDSHHLSIEGARLMLTPLLTHTFRKLHPN